MTWGIESNVIERFEGAGVPREKITRKENVGLREKASLPHKADILRGG